MEAHNGIQRDVTGARPRPTPSAMAEDVRSSVTAEGREARGASLFDALKPCHYDMQDFVSVEMIF